MATEHDWKSIKHDVTPRNEQRMLVEIDVEPTSGSTICGQRVPHGKSRILIFRSELAALQGRTQTDADRALWSTAVKSFEERLREHTKKIKDERSRKHAEETFGVSPSSIYQELRPGSTGLPPVRSFRILNDDVPPPETPQNVQANQMSELAKSLAALVGLGQQPAQKNARG